MHHNLDLAAINKVSYTQLSNTTWATSLEPDPTFVATLGQRTKPPHELPTLVIIPQKWGNA